MTYPDFFDQVPSILLYDPLAEFLGALESGIVEITYLDCVKLAGHSCPTVAGAYLMAKMGLQELFGEELPVRGEIEVLIRGRKGEGVNGVIGTLIAFICGVNDEAGFKGIGGRFSRANKLHYGVEELKGEVGLRSLTTGKSVTLSYDPSPVPPDPAMRELMAALQQGRGGDEEIKEFRRLWQERVAKILLNRELWDRLVTIS